MIHRLLCLASFVIVSVSCFGGETPVSDLRAECRNGQVFLTWKEAGTPEGTTFNVYASQKPMAGTVSSDAELLAHHVETHSARDWWEDPAAYSSKAESRPPVGWIIKDGGTRLDPSGGLFVHTVTAKESGNSLFFAVTHVASDGTEDQRLTAGANVLAEPCLVRAGAIQPVWQMEKGKPFAQDAGKDKPLVFDFHGSGEMYSDFNYLFFGDGSMGWRDGLPFKLVLVVNNDEVIIKPVDRTWIGRKMVESEIEKNRVTAIESFWWGYNSNIYDSSKMKDGVIMDYSAHRVLGLVSWCKSYLGTDPMATYSIGTSMGGSAGIWISMHHPEVFAAVRAQVPVVSFSRDDGKSTGRLTPLFRGKEAITVQTKTEDGTPVWEYFDGVRFIQNAKTDLPYLFISNGRKDGAISWMNNPSFYRALREARQGFAARWDDGEHLSGRDAPLDVKRWDGHRTLFQYRLDRAYVAFSGCSADQNPGNGDPKDGDMVGSMNRGLESKDLSETEDRIEATVLARYKGVAFPLTADATFRRLQKFKVEANAKYKVKIGEEETNVQTGAGGLLTIPGVKITDEKGTRIVITR